MKINGRTAQFCRKEQRARGIGGPYTHSTLDRNGSGQSDKGICHRINFKSKFNKLFMWGECLIQSMTAAVSVALQFLIIQQFLLCQSKFSNAIFDFITDCLLQCVNIRVFASDRNFIQCILINTIVHFQRPNLFNLLHSILVPIIALHKSKAKCSGE